MKSGIYQIRNINNNKLYIGSAVNLIKRKNGHFSALFKNKHENNKLQNAYNKYGKETFIFEILEYCEVIDLIIKEQNYLNKYNPWYNICKQAGSMLGFKHSDETKRKIISARLLNRDKICEIMKKAAEKRNQDYTKQQKSVYQLNKFTNVIIGEYNSIKEASLITNTNNKSISSVLSGRLKTANGFKWKLKLMKQLEDLIKNEFDIKLKLEFISDIDYSVLGKANDLLRELNIIKITFDDEIFKSIYNHENYNSLKLILDRFKTKKDLKLPNKD